MTGHDREVLELLRDDDQPLAIADSAFATELRASRARKYALRALPALAAAVVVAIALIAPWQGGGSLAGRALAALGKGPVVHIVTRQDLGQAVIDLRTGRRSVPRVESEAWYEPSTRRFHVIMRLRGTVVEEFANDRNAQITPSPVFDAFPDGYRKALADGSVRARKGSWHRRAIYWVVFKPRSKDVPRTDIGIDRETYKPVVIRSHLSPRRSYDSEVLLATSVPFQAADFKLRFPNAAAQTRGAYSSTFARTAPAAVDAVLGTSWLWPGRRVAGMALTALHRLGFTTPTSGKGIELDYGRRTQEPPSFTRPYLTIQEARGHELDLGPLPAAGSVSVGKGSTTDEKGREAAQWTGLLRRDGVTISIATSEGERAVVAAARSLRRAR